MTRKQVIVQTLIQFLLDATTELLVQSDFERARFGVVVPLIFRPDLYFEEVQNEVAF